MKFEFEKEFRAAHPETIGETDKEFDQYNYTLWLEQQLKNYKLQSVRFKLPSDQQIIKLAILFNHGNMDKEILINMVSLVDFIIDRLYENGDVSKPSSKEGN